jgi:hypothetical protein
MCKDEPVKESHMHSDVSRYLFEDTGFDIEITSSKSSVLVFVQPLTSDADV